MTGYTGGDDDNTPIKKKSIRSRYNKPSEKTYIMADVKQLHVDQDIWLPPFTGDTNPFMPCLDKDGNYKKVVILQNQKRHLKLK